MDCEEVQLTIRFDAGWYLSQYPDVADQVDRGLFDSALAHFIRSGIHYGFLPMDPDVDEQWYLKQYPDVADELRAGKIRSAKSHFIDHGYREGRLPGPLPYNPLDFEKLQTRSLVADFLRRLLLGGRWRSYPRYTVARI